MAARVAIIGAGQIAYAVAQEFCSANWHVTVYARSAPVWLNDTGLHFSQYELGQSDTPCADLLIDTIAFDAEDIDRYDPNRIGRLIVISSASVYCDDQGRTLDEARQTGFPEFAGQITELQSTVSPGPETYSTRKIRMEQRAQSLFFDRATILRPCAIYGPWSRHPREWWFVKRMLDGRQQVPLMHPHLSRFHATNAADIARAARQLTKRELGGVYNVGDENSCSVMEIGTCIADQLGWSPDWTEVISSESIGRTPWSIPGRFEVSSSSLINDCDLEVSNYTKGSRDAVRWLVKTNPADWHSAFPQLAAYPLDMFDYASEDQFLKTRP